MLSGVVIKALNSYYYVQGEFVVTQCKLRGRFKKERFSLTVGDRVSYALLQDGTGIIEEIAPRTTLLRRPLVANVDQVILTFAAAQPDLSPLLLDRFLVLAEYSGLDILICINKTDLADRERLQALTSEYRRIGYNLLAISALQSVDIDALKAKLKDRISVFAGPSGVGKSTLLNAADGGLRLTTGMLSDKIRRGKHTTRVTELLPFSEGGFVVDTPGFSFTEFDHIAPSALAACFPEFCAVEASCRYSTCLHSHEPQCAVKEAIDAGKITRRRYDAYLNILQEIQSGKKGF